MKSQSTNSGFRWIILAGGLGTRSENPSLPKILQDIGGIKILDQLVASLSDCSNDPVTLVLRHGSREVRNYLNLHHPDSNWDIVEDLGVGPVPALQEGANHFEENNFGCILGDSVFRAPLERIKKAHIDASKPASVVLRQSTHLEDSDKFALNWQNSISCFLSKEQSASGKEGTLWASTGLIFIKKNLLPLLRPEAPDVVTALMDVVEFSDVNVIKSSYYHRDSGTPQRLASIRIDNSAGLLDKKLCSQRPALFIDRDGTLIPDLGTARKNVVADEINPKIAVLIRMAKLKGIPSFLVTNQPGIAKGAFKFNDVDLVHNNLQQVLISTWGTYLDDIAYCPHHPERGFAGEVRSLKIDCLCRKPKPGMILELAYVHHIDLPSSLFIGDSNIDRLAAEFAGVPYVHPTAIDTVNLDERGIYV